MKFCHWRAWEAHLNCNMENHDLSQCKTMRIFNPNKRVQQQISLFWFRCCGAKTVPKSKAKAHKSEHWFDLVASSIPITLAHSQVQNLSATWTLRSMVHHITGSRSNAFSRYWRHKNVLLSLRRGLFVGRNCAIAMWHIYLMDSWSYFCKVFFLPLWAPWMRSVRRWPCWPPLDRRLQFWKDVNRSIQYCLVKL